MQTFAESSRLKGKIIGFVPTMGALHKGHIKLIEMAVKKADLVVVSIFVNPAQFGPHEDYSRYPRAFKADCNKIEEAGASIVFHPSVSDIYPADYSTYIDIGPIGEILEGERRPGHFRGVAIICAKLFNITKPHFAVFGQKDGQQLAVIRKMVRELNFDLQIIRGPIVRTSSGIAMSSRHLYLDEADLKKAVVIKQSLDLAASLIKSGMRSAKSIELRMRQHILAAPGADIDYISFNRWDDLAPIKSLAGEIIISLVVKFNNVRLLDNLIIKIPS